MKHLADFIRQPQISKKIDYEFQDICLSLMELFGEKYRNRIWSLPHQKWWTNEKGRDALKIIKNSEICTLDYYIGMVRKFK